MPADASVCSFSAKTAHNTYRGIVEERETSLEEYKNAIAKGNSAYMLESHRDNIFQVSLGNVDKSESIEVNISYIQDLKVAENEIRLVIPTVVGVRYIPGHPTGEQTGMGLIPPTSQVPDADFITPTRGETSFMANIEIQLSLDSDIKDIQSPSHSIKPNINQETASISLSQVKMDSDFVLNIILAALVKDTYFTAEQNSEFFSYLSFTPRIPSNAVRRQKEFIFMIDISGSMTGPNIESAKRALKLCLRNMADGDRFNIIAFETYLTVFSKKCVPYDESTFENANRWVDSLFARGGTEIDPAIRFAVNSADCSDEFESIILLLTDGQIGNEDEIINYVKRLFKGRIFTLGIDTNVNDSFLNKIAEVCDGFAEYYYPGGGEDLDKTVVKQFLRTDAAVLTDISVPQSCELAGGIPQTIYDGDACRLLFKSKQYVDPIEITGSFGDGAKSYSFSPMRSGIDGNFLYKMWAKQIIEKMEKDLKQISPRHSKNAIARITKISKSSGVLCRYTNFIAIKEWDKKFSQFPVAVPIEVSAPRNFSQMLAPDMSMLTISSASPISRAMPMSISLDDSVCCDETDVDVTLCCESFENRSKKGSFFRKIFGGKKKKNNYEYNEDYEEIADASFSVYKSPDSNIAYGHQAASLRECSGEKNLDWTIHSLYNHMYALGSGINSFCGEKLRDIMFSIQTETIDYEHEFFRLDWILYKAWSQWSDKSWLDLRVKLLNELKCADLKKYSTAEIASEQNIDGSFGHTEDLQKHLTLLALTRMLGDDPYLYGRQIKRALTWADNTDWMGFPKEKQSLDELRTLYHTT